MEPNGSHAKGFNQGFNWIKLCLQDEHVSTCCKPLHLDSNQIRIACRGEDKILSYPYPSRSMLSNLNSKAMDKISSYPSGLLEADARAESHWAPRVHSPEKPGDLAPTESALGPSYWARFLPHWASPKWLVPFLGVGRPCGPIQQSWNNSKNYNDFRITAPFSQNEIAQFYQR